MIELTAENAAEILHSRGWLADARSARVSELSGGVSNAVFLIETSSDRFVVKQARGRLRVQADWQCSIERIWREVDVLRACGELLTSDEDPNPVVPRVLWTDHELYAYAMTAADPKATTWKSELLSERVKSVYAYAAGSILGELHAASWRDPPMELQFRDRTYFAQLRLEPYYLVAAANYPRLANQLQRLVDQTWQERHALVHGDFSPKNLLVSAGRMMLIDFEVGHYGDPAFDLGFFLTHLTLKAIHLPLQRAQLLATIEAFWTAYALRLKRQLSAAEFQHLEHRSTQHLAGCLVARVHGKSPVDYLTSTEQLRAVHLAEQLFDLGSNENWGTAYQRLQSELAID